MNINRHNYEEFFILYMDNELSNADRRLVEDFVANNPDLKDELDTLLHYKLEPDTSITFARKEELLMHSGGNSPISLSNYEEWLMLYTDNELSADEKITVEQFCTTHPAVKKELDLLLQTKLQPETIVFADKASLYRKEEKVRPLFNRWMKYAAAILLLLIGAAVIILSGNKKQGSNPDDIIAKEKNSPASPAITPPANNTTNNEMAVTDDEAEKTTPPATTEKNNPRPEAVYVVQPQRQPAVQDKKENDVQRLQDNNPAVNPVTNTVVKTTNDNRPSNNLPQPLQNPNVNGTQPKNEMAAGNVPANTLQPKNTLTTNGVTNKNPASSDIQNASFTENNNGEAFADAGQKKNKLRGFFRKVTRTFEKRTNIDPTDGEDRLLVAGLSIKMK